jgi:hypothetical protein
MLVTSTDDLKQYVKANSSLTFKAVEPFFIDAESKYVRPWLGEHLYKKLDSYKTTTSVDESLRALLPYAARASARFTVMLASASNDINFGESGFTTSSSTTLAPASAQRVDRFNSSIEQLGWDAIEQMLRFLEQNKEAYPDWVESEAYTLSFKSFINSAEVFNSYVNDLGNSRLTFSKLRSVMDTVEMLQVEPVISPEFAEELRIQLREESLTQTNKAVYKLICAAVANLTWYEYHLPDDSKQFTRFEIAGKNFLAAARKVLDKSPDNYPTYKASSTYITDKIGMPSFENDSSKKAFFFY